MISLNSAISALNTLSFKGVELPEWLGDVIFLVLVVCLLLLANMALRCL